MQKSNKFITSSLIILLLSTAIYKFSKITSSNTSSHGKQSKVNLKISGYAKIIDGDSIIVDNYEIRLKAIDAPEFYQNCQNSKQETYPCGRKAMQYLENLTANKKVTCQSYATDIYDRYLSSCYVGNIDIAIDMLEHGWAVIYRMPSPLYKHQEQARISKLGLWQGEFTYPQIWRKLNKRK
ncbi:MAG: thermonuclease family protein [Rickettsiales bacterium]|jgi:endonuclease YncB( thermonuclease family)|nr:thermonuclease family protein [Rickettsiales bacterium]